MDSFENASLNITEAGELSVTDNLFVCGEIMYDENPNEYILDYFDMELNELEKKKNELLYILKRSCSGFSLSQVNIQDTLILLNLIQTLINSKKINYMEKMHIKNILYIFFIEDIANIILSFI